MASASPLLSTTATTPTTSKMGVVGVEEILSHLNGKCFALYSSRVAVLLKAWAALPLDVGCSFQTFTTLLGYFLIILVAVGHLPLLFNVLRSRNGKTYVSPTSLLLLVLTSSNYVSYAVYMHLPFSTWGEGVVQLTLYVIISNLMLLHEGRHKQAVTFTFLYVLAMIVALMPLVPGYMLVLLKVSNLSINALRKVVWVYRYHTQGRVTNTPVLSSILFLNVCSFGRLLTAAVHTRDFLFLLCYGLDCIFGGVLTVLSVRRRRMRKKALMKAQQEVKGG